MPARKSPPVSISNDQHEIKIYTTSSHGRPLYQLSFYRGGKRERRSFADLNEAKREARGILGSLATDSVQAETLSAADIESYTIARRILAAVQTPVHVAAEIFVSARDQLPPTVSIADAVRYFIHFNRGVKRVEVADIQNEFLESRQAMGVSALYLKMIRRNIGRFAQATKGRLLPDLRARDLDEYLRKAEMGPETKNCFRKHILTFSHWAMRRGYLPRDWKEFEDSIVFKVPPKDVEIFTPEEMTQLFYTSGTHLATPFLAIGAFAGLRSAEIERLNWKNVRLDRGFIEVRADTCKTRARRLVPIADNLRAWLKPFALPEGPVVPYDGPSNVLGRIALRAKVTWKKNALRHSYVSYRLAATNDGAKTALEAGHDQGILFKHYREVVDPESAEKWFAIMPSFAGGIATK